MGSRDQTRSFTGVVHTLNCGACPLAPHSVCVCDVSPKYFLTLIFILYATTVSVVYRPLDFVGTFSNRWSYGVAFGATANKVMFLFSEGYQPLKVPQWAQGTRPTSHILGMSPGHTCSQRPRGLSKGINSVRSHILLVLLLTQSQCLVARNAFQLAWGASPS